MLKSNIVYLLRSVFSIGIMLALLGGVVTFVLLLAALLIGGAAGQKIAITTTKVYLPYFINAAAVAIMSGLLVLYVTAEHELSLDVEKAEQPDKEK